jgi:hypothetical protein
VTAEKTPAPRKRKVKPFSDEARMPRRALVAAGSFLVLGLALVSTGSSDEGALVTLTGLALAIYGIHRFGRLGPEAAL